MERSTIVNGKIHYKWPFSIAMLVHQRVYPIHIPLVSHYTSHLKPGQASAARRRRRMMQLGIAFGGSRDMDSQPQQDGHVALIGFVKNIGPKSSGLSWFIMVYHHLFSNCHWGVYPIFRHKGCSYSI